MSDQADFAALKTAVDTGSVQVDVDLKRVCHPNCPLPFGHLKEKLVYVYLGLIGVAIGTKSWFAIPTEAFWIAIGIGSLFYWIFVRKVAENRMRRHVVAYVLEDENRWRQLWRFGGLAVAGNDGAKVDAPKGDWRTILGLPQG